jgi:hypothetical protein
MYNDASRWLEIRRRVLVDGVSKRRVCRENQIHWSTLERILQHELPPGRKQTPRRRPALGPFERYIEEMLEEDERLPRKRRHTARQVHRRLKGLGYRGSYGSIRDYLAGRKASGNDYEALLREILDSPLREARALLQLLSAMPPNRLSAR